MVRFWINIGYRKIPWLIRLIYHKFLPAENGTLSEILILRQSHFRKIVATDQCCKCVRQHEEQWLQHGAKTIWNRAAFLGQLKKAGVDFCSIDLRVGSLAGNQLSLKAGVAETQSMTYDFCEQVAMIRDFYRIL
jgi:hypothetical protein